VARRLAPVLAALLALAGAHTALGASPGVPCRLGGGPLFASFESLPEPVSVELLRRFAPDDPEQKLAGQAQALIARAGANWQATDVVMPGQRLPGRRFILGDGDRDQLRVWYESGGIAHMYHVAKFARNAARRWTLSRHLAAGSLASLCRRLEAEDASIYDQYW